MAVYLCLSLQLLGCCRNVPRTLAMGGHMVSAATRDRIVFRMTHTITKWPLM